jgi:hypothetical protein
MSKRKFKLQSNGVIINQDGCIVGTIYEHASEEDKDTILNSPEILEVAEEFVEKVETGKLRPKETYNKFKSVLQ